MAASEEPNNGELTAEDVIDALAAIALQRQELHSQEDPEAWRRMTLEKLEEIRRRLEEDLRLHGPSPERSEAAQALRVEIARVKGSAGAAKQDPSKAARSKRPMPHPRDARRQQRPGEGSRRMRRRSGH